MMYIAVAVSIAALLVVTNAQIPTVCADRDSLVNLECCPETVDGTCGEFALRGFCGDVKNYKHDKNTTDARANWPHYYTRVCQCLENYGGVDCSRCKFGYYGEKCEHFAALPRLPVRDLMKDQVALDRFLKAIKDTKTYPSGYSVPVAEALPGTYPLDTIPLSIFNYLAWSHQYAAKDAPAVDYGHGGPGFFTWHRFMNLLLEQDIQYMLKDQKQDDYHTFRLPYYDWRSEIQNSAKGLAVEDLFVANLMGDSTPTDPRVRGGIFGTLNTTTGRIDDGFDTLCFNIPGQLCDPRVSTGELRRCPRFDESPCQKGNEDWPTQSQVDHILSQTIYDSPPYNMFSLTGFRNYIDVNITENFAYCGAAEQCFCFTEFQPDVINPTCPPSSTIALEWTMHSVVHVIVGQEDQQSSMEFNRRGHMNDVGASPNDPFFYIHHTMVDCVFQTWRTKFPDVPYAVSVDPEVFPIADGHHKDDILRGWFPLYTNGEIYAQSDNFGYTCALETLSM